jgi:hypothetical protein
MIHLFLDDSGKESQATMPWVCMAGYLADYDVTVSLIEKWHQLLITHRIRERHMKHLIPISGPYAKLGWDTEKRDAVVHEFIQAINETHMFGVGVAVEMAAWRKRKKDHPELAWGTVQQFCLERILMRVIGQLQDAGMDDSLALVFDTDPEFGITRFNLFCALMGHDERAARRLTSITFGHPEHYPGLQAADLLAWETRKELMQKKNGQQSTRRWQAMFTRMPDYHLEYTVGERWDDEAFGRALPQIIKTLPLSSAESESEADTE